MLFAVAWKYFRIFFSFVSDSELLPVNATIYVYIEWYAYQNRAARESERERHEKIRILFKNQVDKRLAL